MTFTSLPFFVFSPIVFLLYIVMPARLRWALLLAASYFFYACLKVPHLLIVLMVVTAVAFVCGQQIYKYEAAHLKRLWLWLGILTNISILVWLKYVPFLSENLNLILGWTSFESKFITPHQLVAIGASYFIFQSISYLMDIYLEVLEPENNLGYFALSMSFFPKLLQGPIERSGNLLPQLRELSPVSWDNVRAGVHLFLWGMFKKVVVADHLAMFVDPVYNNVHEYYGLSLVIATYLFALQLFFDFSGYTDMALGIARCFNIRLTQNFNAPYLATSTADFWRRWHISFSSWILDYIFKPLQFYFRDWPKLGTPLALMLTFIVSGAWHGASWCFIIWGTLHGIYLGSSILFKQPKRRLCKAMGLDKSKILKVWQIFSTFHLICFSWIFFRAANIKDALYVVWSSISDVPRSIRILNNSDGAWINHILLGKTVKESVGVLTIVAMALCIGLLNRRMSLSNEHMGELSWMNRFPFWAKGCIYGIFCYMILFNGASAQSFIYLQF